MTIIAQSIEQFGRFNVRILGGSRLLDYPKVEPVPLIDQSNLIRCWYEFHIGLYVDKPIDSSRYAGGLETDRLAISRSILCSLLFLSGEFI